MYPSNKVQQLIETTVCHFKDWVFIPVFNNWWMTAKHYELLLKLLTSAYSEATCDIQF